MKTLEITIKESHLDAAMSEDGWSTATCILQKALEDKKECLYYASNGRSKFVLSDAARRVMTRFDRAHIEGNNYKEPFIDELRKMLPITTVLKYVA